MPEVRRRKGDGARSVSAACATRPPVRRPGRRRRVARAAAALGCALLLAATASWPAKVRADGAPPEEVQLEPTFAYTTQVEANYARMLFELSGVITAGFLWYVTQTDIVEDYDVNYSWEVFRKKLTGEAVRFDTNHFGTNFIGHPLGGTAYYLAARSNRLSIAASFGIATGGSLLWEYFGEAREVVSLNDMIVTPLAGLAIGEPLTQLGAFFDRSGPSLRNRILGSVFAPFKSLNDLFDGARPARAERLDRYGFPADEGHEFNLGVGMATTFLDPPAPGEPGAASYEFRLALASRLARLPSYNGAAQHSLMFDDGNVSSVSLAAAFAPDGLLDMRFATDFVALGHYFRNTRLERGALWGYDTVIGLTAGYQYSLHDYDRDQSSLPLDRLSSVQTFGVLFEHRGFFGALRTRARLEASPSFGGITPYALSPEDIPSEQVSEQEEVPDLIRGRQYYFGLGGSAGATLGLGVGPLELEGSVRYERHAQVDGPRAAKDERLLWSARAGTGIPGTPIRATAFVDGRSRAGELGEAHKQRSELSVGLEIGARF